MKFLSVFSAIIALMIAMSLPAHADDKKFKSAIPDSSKFAKLEVGMGQKQVSDLIGTWSDSEHYQTGKAHIPFYRGKDTHRSTLYYKGEGTLTMTHDNRILSINYDPSEDGYR